jgi:tRNA(fMet)-specific endonuclease VapC
MDPAQLGVVLDSSVVIEAERQRLDVARFLRSMSARLGERQVALCAVTVAEVAHGVYRANTAERRQFRRRFLDDLKAALVVYSITVDTAELAGRIGAEASHRGVVIPFDDLLIGACALEHGSAIATHNHRHFENIPDLVLIRLNREGTADRV